MRASLVAVILCLFYGPALATVRGAQERAFWYTAYLMEDFWEDSSKADIASGCTPQDRDSLLGGGKKRCTLPEFMRYIWRDNPPDPSNPSPPPPAVAPHVKYPPGRIDWGSAVLKPWDMTAVQIQQAISNVKVIDPATGVKSALIKEGNGYTGYHDAPKMLAGSTYFGTNEAVAERVKLAHDEYVRRAAIEPGKPGALGADKDAVDKLKSRFENLKKQNINAAELSIALREKDKATYENGRVRYHLRQKFPGLGPNPTAPGNKFPDVITDTVAVDIDGTNMNRKETSIDKTAAAWVVPGGYASLVDAKADLNALFATFGSGTSGVNHGSAIAALKAALATLQTCI